MATLIDVDDAADPRLADYVELRDMALRKSLEAEHGLFIAEGEKVVRRAVGAGYEVRSFLMARRWLAGLSDVLDRTDAPCYVVSDRLAEEITGFHVHRGALASLHRPPLPSVTTVLEGAHAVVVLEDIVDHTNVGAVFRTAAAFGIDAVLLSPRCADPLYRRAVKVSMGAVLSLPYARVEDWYGASDRLRDMGLRVVALTPDEDAVPIEHALGTGNVALLFGSEGHGLSERWLRSADVRAKIPMAAGVDSLNIAASCAIACYAVSRAADHDAVPARRSRREAAAAPPALPAAARDQHHS